MNPEIKTWLFDILQSINEIASYYKDRPKIFAEYENDIRTKRAIERNIPIRNRYAMIDLLFLSA